VFGKKKGPGLKEGDFVFSSPSELNNFISKKIRKIKNIKGTLTLIGIDGQE